jgi:hypothetical protein
MKEINLEVSLKLMALSKRSQTLIAMAMFSIKEKRYLIRCEGLAI